MMTGYSCRVERDSLMGHAGFPEPIHDSLSAMFSGQNTLNTHRVYLLQFIQGYALLETLGP